jgi:hypothetical protein
VKTAHVTARRPEEVAHEVERLARAGCMSFLISRIDDGAMLDLERLGAARYTAGIQSEVALEAETPAVAATR